MVSFRKRRNARNKTVTNDVFLNIQNGCGDISGLNTSISNDELFEIVDDQPCVSAVSFARFQNKIFYDMLKCNHCQIIYLKTVKSDIFE